MDRCTLTNVLNKVSISSWLLGTGGGGFDNFADILSTHCCCLLEQCVLYEPTRSSTSFVSFYFTLTINTIFVIVFLSI